MKKAGCLFLAIIMVLVMGRLSVAAEVEQIPVTIMGHPATVVVTTIKGGPAKQGLLGTTYRGVSTYAEDNGGNLKCLSTTQGQSDGLLKGVIVGVGPAATLGGFQVWAASQITSSAKNVTTSVNNASNTATNAANVTAKATADANAIAVNFGKGK